MTRVSADEVEYATIKFVRHRVGEDFLRGMNLAATIALLTPRVNQWRGACRIILESAAEYREIMAARDERSQGETQ